MSKKIQNSSKPTFGKNSIPILIKKILMVNDICFSFNKLTREWWGALILLPGSKESSVLMSLKLGVTYCNFPEKYSRILQGTYCVVESPKKSFYDAIMGVKTIKG